MFVLDNFKLASCFCRKEGYGGAAVYVQKDMQVRIRKKLNLLSIKEQIECACIECHLGQELFIVITIYRPPNGDLQIFFSQLELLLIQIVNENKKVLVAGDFNIELAKDNNSKADFLSIMNSFLMYPTIHENTRITLTSKSCIDNIFCNFTVDILSSSILQTCISDHTAQKVIFKHKEIEISKPYFKRSFSVINKNNFVNSLKQQDWADVFAVERLDVNLQWSIFIGSFIRIFNECFPKKLVNKKNKKNNLYKNTEEIKEIKNRLDILLSLKNISAEYTEMYKDVKKQYDSLLIRSRSEKYANRINNSDNKNKCMWSIHNEITGKLKTSDTMVSGNAEDISNNYNDYLLKVVPELMNNHIRQMEWHSNFQKNNNIFRLKPVSTEEILKFNQKIKNKHSSGDDEIPTNLIKLSVPVIVDVICYIINNSLNEGIFPEQLKLSLIKPLYKNKGNAEILNNYRPISLLPGFSKLFEIAMCDQIMKFMRKLLSDNQHGYLEGRSTQTALFQFIGSILGHLEEGKMALGIFLDLSKAYDCLDRELLIKKLELYGIRGNALRWFESYLSQRTQRVIVKKNNIASKSRIMQNTVGIPQGSILGPILFIIFVNDLNFEINNEYSTITAYADDTNLLVGGEQVHDIVNNAKDIFSTSKNWFDNNKLLLNKEKTGTILFRTKLSRKEKPEFIELDENQLTIQKNTKFLGIYIDEFLDWSAQIEYLSSKLNRTCYCLRIVSRYLNETARKTLYFANFEASARFGIIFWGTNSKIQKIFVIQKRVLRVLYNMPYLESCRGIFKSNRILTIFGLYIFDTILFFHKNRSNMKVQSQHNYNTRTNDLNYPIHRLTLSEKSPHYMGIKFYNKLSDDIKTVPTENKFKRKVKKLLLDLEPYSVNDFLEM